MQHRRERVYVETDRHRISGVLTLPTDGYRSRLSDFLNASERDFISLTECVVELIGDWAITPRGLQHIDDDRRAVSADDLLSNRKQAQVALLADAVAEGDEFGDAFDTAVEYLSGEDRRAARERVPRA